MNPDDLADLELTKDAVANYLIVQPIEGGQSRGWRLPIVHKPLCRLVPRRVLATAAEVLDRQQVTFEISMENSDGVENVATARVEERLASAVYRAESIATGEFEQYPFGGMMASHTPAGTPRS